MLVFHHFLFSSRFGDIAVDEWTSSSSIWLILINPSQRYTIFFDEKSKNENTKTESKQRDVLNAEMHIYEQINSIFWCGRFGIRLTVTF